MMLPETLKQKIEQFDTRHGDSVCIDGSWLIFRDGATRELNQLGALQEPPADDYQRCRLIVRFHDVRLRRAVDKFADLRNSLASHASANAKNGMAPPPPDMIEKLRELQMDVRERQAELEKAKADLEATDKMKRHRERDAEMAKARQANEAFLDQLKQINV